MSGPSLIVGRGPQADIAVGDDSVSARHAELSLTRDGRLFVTDCDSRNGTFVQDGDRCERIRQGVIPATATVLFGSCAIPAEQLLELLRSAIDGGRAAPPPRGWVRCAACGAPRRRRTTCEVCGAGPSGAP
jgi:pSer/pThr/pTyr-binding forkhead associated (FHA) protein